MIYTRGMCRCARRHHKKQESKYATYYNELRTHGSLGKDAPVQRAIQHVGASHLCCPRRTSSPLLQKSDFRYRQGNIAFASVIGGHHLGTDRIRNVSNRMEFSVHTASETTRHGHETRRIAAHLAFCSVKRMMCQGWRPADRANLRSELRRTLRRRIALRPAPGNGPTLPRPISRGTCDGPAP